VELSGKLIELLPVQSGEGRNGPWKKQDVIIETEGDYPKKVCLSIWGDRMKDVPLQTGQQYRFSIDLESREFKGKWYTNAKAYRIEPMGASSPDDINQDYYPDSPHTDESSDDLPF
jgi:hypothetical protein